MRLTVTLISLILLAVSTARAQAPALINPTGAQPAAGTADLPANATADQILDALDQRGQTLREFTAKVSMTTGDFDRGDVSTSTGQVMFQKKTDNDSRIRVAFDKRTDANHLTRAEKVEYLLDNGWLIDRHYRQKTEDRRQVVKPGDKLNLLKLGEGPFPLPIGQKKEDVYSQFDVKVFPLSKEDQSDKDLANTVHVQLKPKPGTQFARRFGAIEVWVSRTTHFPIRIMTDTPDSGDPHVTDLKDLQINPPGGLKDEDFKLPSVDQGAWSLQTEAYKQ